MRRNPAPQVAILYVAMLASPLALPGTTVLPAGPVIDVPRGASIVIDGRIDDEEWRGAVISRLPDGSALRLLHDGVYVFLGITATREGFPSVCVADGQTIRVFHASAALGSVVYTRSTRGWTTRETEFVYGMRTPDLTERARQERREYLAQHGWLGSTLRMGGGRVQEMQIALDRVSSTPAIALAYYAIGAGDTGAVVRWPESLPPGDGCADEMLVRGHVPSPLLFNPPAWPTLRLVP